MIIALKKNTLSLFQTYPMQTHTHVLTDLGENWDIDFSNRHPPTQGKGKKSEEKKEGKRKKRIYLVPMMGDKSIFYHSSLLLLSILASLCSSLCTTYFIEFFFREHQETIRKKYKNFYQPKKGKNAKKYHNNLTCEFPYN